MDGDVTVRVVFTDGLSHLYTGGKKEFEIQARNLRGIIKALDAQYPGLAEHLEEETTVAIDGEIHESGNYVQPVREGSEVFFIPKLEGG
jgi:sulfur-carrier protein